MALEVELDQVELRLAEDGPANPGEWIPKLVSLAAVVVVARAVHDLSGGSRFDESVCCLYICNFCI